MTRAVDRRRLLGAGGALAAAPWLAHAAPPPRHITWSQRWQAFVQRFVQADGRVIDDQHETRYTSSEGQAYALFFALVAGERARFDVLLRWTDRELAGGRLGERLPGWRWGRHEDGGWRLLDANAASDADLWLAYSLLEAARRWRAPDYARLGRDLLARIAAQEVTSLPNIGPVLLPGPAGFRLADGDLRLNPSYLVLPQLRGLAAHDPSGPWRALAQGLPALLRKVAPMGLVPDWARLDSTGEAPTNDDDRGSYDAIRAYLWAGLIPAGDPLRAAMLQATSGMARLLAQDSAPPRSVRARRGERAAEGEAPAGFSAALLPWLRAAGQSRLAEAQRARLAALADPQTPALAGRPATYYDQALALFGCGADEGVFAFDARGGLRVAAR